MAEDKEFTHIILTRYFTRFSYSASDINEVLSPNREWLADRLQKFRTYCFPSVISQSVQNFNWLIYFDVHTPADYIEQVRSVIGSRENIQIVICDGFDSLSRQTSITNAMKRPTKWLLTTRLDTDDGWNREFISIIQSHLNFEKREFLNFPVGIIYYDGKTFLYRHKSNAFISLLEPTDGFLTVFCEKHLYLERIAPVRQLPEYPAFLQVVHENTRSNKPRGVRVPRLLSQIGFEAIFGPAADTYRENEWAIAAYNFGNPLMWMLRDRAVAILRKGKSTISNED
jgi:Putative rhamnosyl transferase